jgi:hypothetical protein
MFPSDGRGCFLQWIRTIRQTEKQKILLKMNQIELKLTHEQRSGNGQHKIDA